MGRGALTLAAPGVPLMLGAALWDGSPAIPTAAAGYPYAVLTVVALLGWRFQRSRIVAAAVAVVLALAAVPLGPEGAERLAAAILAPCFAVLALMADRRLGAPRGLAQAAIAPVLTGVGAYVLHFHPEVVAWLAAPAVVPAPFLAAGGGLLVLAAVAMRRRRATEAGLFWAALAATISVAAPADAARSLWALAAALALGVALVEAAYALAFRDELTDLPGRRSLRSLLTSLRPPYAIAVVDVDRFKNFNDRYGHDVGDQVLRMVAARLREVGGGGRAFRSGGEEFTLVFPGCTRDDALPHLEAVRRAVAESPFVLRGRLRPRGGKGAARRGTAAAGVRRLRVTVSIGVAQPGTRGSGVDGVVKSADKAMYRAKKQGRNRVAA